jgi:hypothetical protein
MADLQPDNPATDEAHIPWETLDGAEEVAGLQDADLDEAAIDEEPAAEPLDEVESVARPAPARSVITSPVTVEPDPVKSFFDEPPRASGGWTITALCAGLALLACTVLIPQADANRRLSYERQTLRNDLENVEKQIAVNQEFIRQVGQDPTLAERLARRQMKVIPAGNKILEMPAQVGDATMSPFQLTNIGRPAPLPAYKPVGGFIASVCYSPRARLYLIGIALVMVATGLVLGGSSKD